MLLKIQFSTKCVTNYPFIAAKKTLGNIYVVILLDFRKKEHKRACFVAIYIPREYNIAVGY